MRIVVIDNYDSFTWNLCHLFARITGSLPIVRRNDEVSWAELLAFSPDGIVLSPGPGHPGVARDFGVCKQILEEARVPVWGVCLGHQGLALSCGVPVVPANPVMHGRASLIHHSGTGLFKDIPQSFRAIRYHSLLVDSVLPPELEKIAWTADGEVMGIRHRERPFWGVQFHPESICSEYGEQLVRNFLLEVEVARTKRTQSLQRHTFDFWMEPETAYLACFAQDQCSFWLDSSLLQPGSARWSFMGGTSIPGSYVVKYDSAARTLSVGEDPLPSPHSLFDFLQAQLASSTAASDTDGFHSGFVGYLGYELKRECGFGAANCSSLPDAQLLYTPAVLAFDHVARQMSLTTFQATLSTAWLTGLEQCLRSADSVACEPAAMPPFQPTHLRHDAQSYADLIGECLYQIQRGESYELCLTNMLYGPPVNDPLSFYRLLRHRNPAPYSAFLRFGSAAIACVSPERFLRVDRNREVTSKPIKGTSRRSNDPQTDIQFRDTLANSEKERAEHLMIVDLVRNDIGRVVEPASVSVPSLMVIESYATVHQMVSTISGRLRDGCTAVDALRAAFPPGSMTGAPKHRTLEILDRLEGAPRGVYSGSIGYLGLDGYADWNVVIRSAVMTPSDTTVGAGGAITALSHPEAEFDEVLLKLRSVLPEQ